MVKFLPVHEELPPPLVTPMEYRAALLDILMEGNDKEIDPFHFTIAELQDLITGYGLKLPGVQLPEHYEYSSNWYTRRGTLSLCVCGAIWPCPLADTLPIISERSKQMAVATRLYGTKMDDTVKKYLTENGIEPSLVISYIIKRTVNSSDINDNTITLTIPLGALKEPTED